MTDRFFSRSRVGFARSHHRSEAMIARMAKEADRLVEARGGIARPRVPYRMEPAEEDDEERDARIAKAEVDSIAEEISRRLTKRENGRGLP